MIASGITGGISMRHWTLLSIGFLFLSPGFA
jgi:hypothetical protein